MIYLLIIDCPDVNLITSNTYKVVEQSVYCTHENSCTIIIPRKSETDPPPPPVPPTIHHDKIPPPYSPYQKLKKIWFIHIERNRDRERKKKRDRVCVCVYL